MGRVAEKSRNSCGFIYLYNIPPGKVMFGVGMLIPTT